MARRLRGGRLSPEKALLAIDGSLGEGGGQVLRTSLALSLVTGRPFRIARIRAGRRRPGLMRQHLAAVRAAAEVSRAAVEGAEIGSRELEFRPGPVAAGDYSFSVGTAGSATLVFQTVLPALMLAGRPSALALEGGTHNPLAPPFDFLARAFVPLLRRMGPEVEVALDRPGFQPAGGGRFRASIRPAAAFSRLDLLERGEVRRRRAVATVASLPRSIGEREVAVVAEALGWEVSSLEVRVLTGSPGPGNVLTIEIESERVTEVFTGFGERGVRAEAVAAAAAAEAKAYLASGAPVGPHLADQLLLPLALAGGGRFRTQPPTLHATTQVEIIRRFLGLEIACAEVREGVFELDVPALGR